MTRIEIYDTTLRDGAQREGISFSVLDKLHIAQKLDEFGVDYIEGGWPGANPKDNEFFQRAALNHFKNARLVAFGSTRKAGVAVESDVNIRALLESGAPVVTLVGKSSAPQVEKVLATSLEENIAMVADSIRYLKSKGRAVFLDAEHFFDGFKADKDYSLKVLSAAEKAGADCLVLCDTNGGSLPEEVGEAVRAVVAVAGVPVGIHAHNDAELAVANTLAAVRAGATQVQGTVNGYGERCGNANLCSIIPALKLKIGLDVIDDQRLSRLADLSHFVSEAANLAPDPFLPYVGHSAFSHKAGLHVSGLSRWVFAYQHIDPAAVGNKPRTLVSELAGRANIIQRAQEIGVALSPRSAEAQSLLERVKQLESMGFQYENAEASFDLLVHRAGPGYRAPFELIDFMVVIEKRRRRPTIACEEEEMMSEAIVKVRVNGEVMHTAAEGNGPVNALDLALRKALLPYYPALDAVKLTDFKVRVLEESTGTESLVRVLIESSNGAEEWHTVGASANLIEASWLALVDSLEYFLLNRK
ncbi:citramalate synthase [Dehalogenimonas alkenigignens]|uniref:Citramalate synthase n=1 Tax=Dehalogenimonas alkenigignens TaxID=1217799 RepID=A0A0W0GJH3_9CHLR|nr:citramalate synthase [Dehalogenimonas alkenigignens]KTB48675.1 2-isopropylmalate synthase [Dehalogenimonas alkenigignens]PVV84907.1 citramalate synthase [Dehalogenimonas alkenigignens]